MLEAIRSLSLGSNDEAEKAHLGAGEALPDLGVTAAPRRRLDGGPSKTYAQAYGGSEAIDWVMDCVELIAETASNAEYHFEREDDDIPATRLTQASDLPTPPDDLKNLFERPNPFMDYTELLELSVIDFLLAGEVIWWKFHPKRSTYLETGRPLALYRLNPAWVEVELNDRAIPVNYILTVPGGKPVSIPADAILHIKRPNPHDPHRGLSKIAGNPRVYDMELALTESATQYYEQGTRLSGIITAERSIPPKSWEKFKRTFTGFYSGAKNAYKIAMLDRGAKFETVSGTAVEAALVEMVNLSKERIAKAFRVPMPLLGEVGGSTDRQAVREAQRIFDNKTMRPLLNRLQKQISLGLTQAWGWDFIIDYEYVMPVEDQLDLAEALGALPGVQVKDVRAQVGLPPLADQKAEWAVIDDLILNLPGEDREEGGHADKNLGSEAGRPPKPESTRAIPSDGSIPAGAAARKALVRQLRGDATARRHAVHPDDIIDRIANSLAGGEE